MKQISEKEFWASYLETQTILDIVGGCAFVLSHNLEDRREWFLVEIPLSFLGGSVEGDIRFWVVSPEEFAPIPTE